MTFFMRPFVMLPKEELLEALAADNNNQLCVGVRVAFHMAYMLELLLADGRALVVPPSFFTESGDGTKPDFENVRPTDHGLTLALGEYEAAVDYIIEKAAEGFSAA